MPHIRKSLLFLTCSAVLLLLLPKVFCGIELTDSVYHFVNQTCALRDLSSCFRIVPAWWLTDWQGAAGIHLFGDAYLTQKILGTVLVVLSIGFTASYFRPCFNSPVLFFSVCIYSALYLQPHPLMPDYYTVPSFWLTAYAVVLLGMLRTPSPGKAILAASLLIMAAFSRIPCAAIVLVPLACLFLFHGKHRTCILLHLGCAAVMAGVILTVLYAWGILPGWLDALQNRGSTEFSNGKLIIYRYFGTGLHGIRTNIPAILLLSLSLSTLCCLRSGTMTESLRRAATVLAGTALFLTPLVVRDGVGVYICMLLAAGVLVYLARRNMEKTDLFLETLILNIKKKPFLLLMLPWLVFRHGIAHVKKLFSGALTPRIGTLPCNPAVLALIHEARQQGRKVYLVTAAHSSLAQDVADRFGVFDGVFASGPGNNLKSARKRDFLLSRFGDGGYDYAGNSLADVPVWEHARKAWIVEPTLPLSIYLKCRAPSWKNRLLPPSAAKAIRWRAWIREMRLYQWVKNVLLFVPLFCSHIPFHAGDIPLLLLAFFLFGICSSSIYLFNDVADLEADRDHPHKKNRPVAAGQISIFQALTAACLFAFSSLALSALFLPWKFTVLLVVYFAVNSLYSFQLKKMRLYDIFCLAFLYTLRIVAGGFLLHIHLSYWLLLFSGTFFLGLAFLKRYSELLETSSEKRVSPSLPGRGYSGVDMPLVQTMGVACGFISCLVLALYTHSAETALLYTHQTLLGMLSPLFLFWCCRLWLIANRGEMHHDPVFFALTDKVSYIVCLLAFVIVYASQ